MINFRYHVVSIVAVFLALGIGVIMGTSVIDRAVVDRLERQQSSLSKSVDGVRSENSQLRAELRKEQQASSDLADQGSQRLLNGALAGTPVLVVGSRGGKTDGLDDFLTLLGRAKADYRGTLWLTDRFTLDGGNEVRDLSQALGFRADATAGTLRSAATTRLADALRPQAGDAAATAASALITALRSSGFLDYDAPEGAPNDTFPALDPATRIVVTSGAKASVPDRQLMLPFVRALVGTTLDAAPAPVLAISAQVFTPAEDTFVGPVRKDDTLARRLSTLDDIDTFAGRLGAVLAIQDLGVGRVGHYGVGSGAQRLLPAPAG
jgi:hypothetical protein